MPEIVKEKRLIENLDKNSKECLKNLVEVLENLQQKVDMSLQFDFQNIQQSDKSTSEYGQIGGVKYTPIQHVNSTGIFGTQNQAFNNSSTFQS